MKISRGIVLAVLLAALPCFVASRAWSAEPASVDHAWSDRAANAAIERWPAGRLPSADSKPAWSFQLGIVLEGVDAAWLNTADPRYFNYIKASVDPLVAPDGSIPTYAPGENQLDDLLLGRQLLLLYGVTEDARFAKAAALLYGQLTHQPRTPSGGFWHGQKFPNQMWVDGIYMAQPFYAEYAATFHHPEAFADIAHQFALIDQHVRDPKTGLLYHGWDESRHERWADKQTGLSHEFWARGMGWYMMALVDTLDYFPQADPGRAVLLAQLERDAAAIAKYQDPKSGLWFQVLDKGDAKGNFLESSASCMFVYALAKAVRRGYLPEPYLLNADRGYKGILAHFIETGPGSEVTLTQTVETVSLGGDPYRDGSYAYYTTQKLASNDPKGVGPFILASVEMENAAAAKQNRGKTVLLDAWYNSQKHADFTGQQVYFHYKWNDPTGNGYSMLGHIFELSGAQTSTLYTAPTVAALNNAEVYLIVSPDIPIKNPKPNYMNAEDAEQVEQWVKAGGVLMIMENDPANADLEHMNLLAEKFGIHFNSVLRNTMDDDKFEMGRLSLAGGGQIFHHPHTIFMRDVCTITAQAPAVAQLRDRGDTLMATAKYGNGTVFATVDPWLYNEYMNGRLPAEYDNFAAGRELAHWILKQVPPTNGVTPYDQEGIDEDIARHLGDVPADPGPKANLSPSLNPAAVRAAIAKVAAWELARMQPYFTRNWTFAALYTGLMAASRATGDARYQDAVSGMGERFHWKLEMEPRWPPDGKPYYDANDQCVGQSYLELYFEKPDPDKIAPTRAALDDLVAGNTVGVPANEAQIAWWWADALYMAPAAETRMYAATHDRKYLEYMDKRWWETWDVLYDKKYHLYYRDIAYLHSKNAQGTPVFWSRGNGWAMGGLVRLLDYLPSDDPSRARFESQLREMAVEVASIQNPKTGLWGADMLDPVDYPQPEVSGSSFITLALAWGVNHGVLDRATYMPVIAKAWRGLVDQIYADGRLGNIQQTGAFPAHYLPSSSYNYGVGAFLAAGEQVAKLDAHASKTAQGHKAP